MRVRRLWCQLQHVVMHVIVLVSFVPHSLLIIVNLQYIHSQKEGLNCNM